MSRGGRGGGRGGFGGRGRGGGFGNANNPPPMGLTFADIQNMSREPTELFPQRTNLPVLSPVTDVERRICELQNGFAQRLRSSQYYIVERVKSDELPRYSDKYRPSPATQPTLSRKDLHQPFFPQEIFEDYFNPRRRKKRKLLSKKSVNLDEIAGEGDEDGDESGAEKSDAGSQAEASDYDVEEEYDNDYAENYFDNGEGDDNDMVGFGGGGDDGVGGGGDYD